MKQVLVIDDSDLFRAFIAQKLEGFGMDVIQAANGFDGAMKLRQGEFDLVIMDFYLSRNSAIEVLEQKQKDPNKRAVPVLMVSAKIDRDKLLQASQLGVRKFLTKPLKMDALVKAMNELLGLNLELDTTPCIIDATCNEGLITIEVARGLNRDKIEMLKYRLQELLGMYKVTQPRVILLLSGIELGPNDGLNLAFLLGTVLDHTRVRKRDLKVLTNAAFVGTFISKRAEYSGIEVVDSFEAAMDGFQSHGDDDRINPITNATPAAAGGAGIAMRFEEEIRAAEEAFDLADLAGAARIAMVDDDFVLREIVKKAFADTGIPVSVFANGKEFVESSDLDDFDLVFLDLMMPVMDGFAVLEALRSQGKELSVIILSALSKRETVVRARGLGVRGYLMKPVTPDRLRTKAVDALRGNF